MVPASGVGADGVREWIWPPASGTSGGGVICAGGGGVPLGFGREEEAMVCARRSRSWPGMEGMGSGAVAW